jgi:hypothetical protein
MSDESCASAALPNIPSAIEESADGKYFDERNFMAYPKTHIHCTSSAKKLLKQVASITDGAEKFVTQIRSQ